MNQKKRVTLKDVAQKTGYTINTVSRALKDKDDVSDETKKIIQETAKEMGYIGDIAASALRSGVTKTIAVIVGDISNPFFGSLVRDIELSAKKNGYSIIIFNSGENSEWERDAILSAYSKRVDGIVICPVQENTENIELLQNTSIPFVLIGRYFKNIKADAVLWDDIKAGEIATSFFISQGHVNILYVGGPLHISSGIDRLQGYRNAHKAAGIPVKEEMIHITNVTTGASRKIVNQALRDNLPFTALLAFSDLMAYEILRALKDYTGSRRTHIPIVGFDNIQEKIMLPLYFPSVDYCGDAAGACVEILLERIRGKSDQNPILVTLEVTLKQPLSGHES